MIWHPQWSVFLFPFYILAVVSQRNRRMYELLSPLLSGCILLYAYTCCPYQLEANMLVWGAAYFVRFRPVLPEVPSILTLLARYLPTTALSMAFAAVLVCVIVFRFDPGDGRPLADRHVPEVQPISIPRAAAGFGLAIVFYLVCLLLSLFVINR